MKQIIWTDQAKADVRIIEKATALRILHALHRFVESGIGDLKALQGHNDELRLRVGDYRIFFVHNSENAIEIRRVKHRREAYRD